MKNSELDNLKQYASKEATIISENESLKSSLNILKEQDMNNNKIIDDLNNKITNNESNFRYSEKTLEMKLREQSDTLLNQQNDLSIEHEKYLEMKSL